MFRFVARYRIAEPDFVHDENGNVVTDRLAGVIGYDYAFTPENRMARVRTRKLSSGNPYDGARILQEAEYGPDGNRWLKVVAGGITGGDAMLTLRDASGQVAVDFVETNDGQGPRASKHYVYGSGRLLAQYSACGPAPQLTVDSMTGTSITFEKLDAAGETWTDHYVVIQDDTGETVKLIGPIENLADTFSVLRSEFSGGGNFVVRVRGESGCGSSGFSNGVTVNLDAAAGSCLDGVALGNWGIDSGTGDATLRMRAHHTCPAGTVFRAVYAQTYMPGFPAQVLEAGLSSPAANIEDTGLTSGLGWDYWFEAHDSGGTPEGDPGMRTTKENWNAYNVAGHAADEASLHVEYLHSDHLGSTRAVLETRGTILLETTTPLIQRVARHAQQFAKLRGSNLRSFPDVQDQQTFRRRERPTGRTTIRLRRTGSFTGRASGPTSHLLFFSDFAHTLLLAREGANSSTDLLPLMGHYFGKEDSHAAVKALQCADHLLLGESALLHAIPFRAILVHQRWTGFRGERRLRVTTGWW